MQQKDEKFEEFIAKENDAVRELARSDHYPDYKPDFSVSTVESGATTRRTVSKLRWRIEDIERAQQVFEAYEAHKRVGAFVRDKEFEAFIAAASDEVKELARARFYRLPDPERPELPVDPGASRFTLRIRHDLKPVREAQRLVLAFYAKKK